MIKLPRTLVKPGDYRLVHENYDLLAKHVTTRMPSIHVRTGPINSDPAASISSTVLYTTATNPSEFGHYRAILSLIVFRAGTGGTVTVTVGWNNGSAAASAATGVLALNTLGAEADLTQSFVAAAGTNITYLTTVTASAGNPSYSLNIKLELLN